MFDSDMLALSPPRSWLHECDKHVHLCGVASRDLPSTFAHCIDALSNQIDLLDFDFNSTELSGCKAYISSTLHKAHCYSSTPTCSKPHYLHGSFFVVRPSTQLAEEIMQEAVLDTRFRATWALEQDFLNAYAWIGPHNGRFKTQVLPSMSSYSWLDSQELFHFVSGKPWYWWLYPLPLPFASLGETWGGWPSWRWQFYRSLLTDTLLQHPLLLLLFWIVIAACSSPQENKPPTLLDRFQFILHNYSTQFALRIYTHISCCSSHLLSISQSTRIKRISFNRYFNLKFAVLFQHGVFWAWMLLFPGRMTWSYRRLFPETLSPLEAWTLIITFTVLYSTICSRLLYFLSKMEYNPITYEIYPLTWPNAVELFTQSVRDLSIMTVFCGLGGHNILYRILAFLYFDNLDSISGSTTAAEPLVIGSSFRMWPIPIFCYSILGFLYLSRMNHTIFLTENSKRSL